MKNSNITIIFFNILIALNMIGCMTISKTKEDLRNAEIKNENISLEGNYQALLKCWDDKAKKQSINFVNQTYTQIYHDLGIAEIVVGGNYGLYAVLFELKRDGKDRTVLNAYGTGYLGEKLVPEWISILKSCQDEVK